MKAGWIEVTCYNKSGHRNPGGKPAGWDLGKQIGQSDHGRVLGQTERIKILEFQKESEMEEVEKEGMGICWGETYMERVEEWQGSPSIKGS